MKPHASQVAAGLAKPDSRDEKEVIVFSKETLKKHYDECVAKKAKMHDAQADYRSALERAEKAGLDKAALKDIIKITSKPEGEDHKATVNIMLEMLGKQVEFHFGDVTKH